MQELVDSDRPQHLLDDTRGRRLLVQLWYPAIPATGTATELLWAGLRRDARTPLWVRALLALSRRRGSTHASAPFDADAAAAALAVYHHGLVSFAAENTSLMEELASRGHIVISIQHQAQWIELQALRRMEVATEVAGRDHYSITVARSAASAARPLNTTSSGMTARVASIRNL